MKADTGDVDPFSQSLLITHAHDLKLIKGRQIVPYCSQVCSHFRRKRFTEAQTMTLKVFFYFNSGQTFFCQPGKLSNIESSKMVQGISNEFIDSLRRQFRTYHQ